MRRARGVDFCDVNLFSTSLHKPSRPQIHTLKQFDAFRLQLWIRRFHQSPTFHLVSSPSPDPYHPPRLSASDEDWKLGLTIVELGLCADVPLLNLLVVLSSQDLRVLSAGGAKSKCQTATHLQLVGRQRDLGFAGVRQVGPHCVS